MFKKLSITNFQSHKDTFITFDPGINVITGTSRSGKTAVLRALRWLYENRPRGNNFIRHTTTRADVILSVDNNDKEVMVARVRDKKDNCYIINTSSNMLAVDDVKYEALRGTVPEEVSEVLNISDINIQSQFDPYFLILDTPGSVGQYVTKITKLDEVDQLLRRFSSKIRKTEEIITAVDNSVDECNSKLDELDRIDFKKYAYSLSVFKTASSRIDDITSSLLELTKLINSTKSAFKQLDKIDPNIEYVIRDANTVLLSYSDIDNDLRAVQDFVYTYSDIDKELISIPDNIDAALVNGNKAFDLCAQSILNYGTIRVDINKVKRIEDELEYIPKDIKKVVHHGDKVLTAILNNVSKINMLYGYINNTKSLIDKYESSSNEYSVLCVKKTELTNSLTVCPICCQELVEDSSLENVLENY